MGNRLKGPTLMGLEVNVQGSPCCGWGCRLFKARADSVFVLLLIVQEDESPRACGSWQGLPAIPHRQHFSTGLFSCATLWAGTGMGWLLVLVRRQNSVGHSDH